MATLVDELSAVGVRSVPWRDTLPAPIVPERVFLQGVPDGLEVAVATASKRPTTADLLKAWKARHGGRACPVLVVVTHPDGAGMKAAVCGPVGLEPPVLHDLDPGQVARLAGAALGEPNRHAATRFILAFLPEAETELPGLRNQGLLATQELRAGVPARPDWEQAGARARPLLGRRGQDLIRALGYEIQPLATNASLLTVKGANRAVAVFLDESESFDAPAKRFGGTTPVSSALALADRQHLSWVLLTRGPQVRLYPSRSDVGVGRKGRAETFVEINLALLPTDKAAYLDLLFSAAALDDNGTLADILERSADYAADLATRLRDRVYAEAVPALANAIARRLHAKGVLSEEDLGLAYEQTLTILFRLLFVAYAEDKELLPYRTNSKYADHSLKRIARRLAEDVIAGRLAFDERAVDLWEDVCQLWRAVAQGNKGWGVPAYDGGLFSDDNGVNPAGAALARIRLTDAELGPALVALLVDEGPDGLIGPVDFRSLSVREFGTIYEGLLESRLSVAPLDLAVDRDGNYVPATKRDKVQVAAGEVYFHNRSGARKATGSYFTKPFAVEHLLDHALEPALDAHLKRLQALVDAGNEAAAADAFFDFRCADIAMGSGHFLVAAIDRIEARLSAFLADHPIPAVTTELERLREAANKALGDLGAGVEIETTSLLRRQVARRCIYGVDRNRIAVELARLAVGIHTFVPGLPLSFLDHNLVCGDSLTGIATIEEAVGILDPGAEAGASSLFRSQIDAFLGRAAKALRRLGAVADATVADLEAARQAHEEALEAIRPARRLFDLLVAARLGEAPVPLEVDEASIDKAWRAARAGDLATELQCLHFPVAFPEVFLRDRSGFDCILGNPPWEEATVEELNFWVIRFPGLKSLRQKDQTAEIRRLRRTRPDLVAEYERELAAADRLRKVLVRGPFPGMGTGDPDVYKAFCWRFWALARDGAAIGVVLPRSALSAKGSAAWRQHVVEHGTFADVTMLSNRGGWVFDDAEHRYTIGLVTVRVGNEQVGTVRLRGPYACYSDYLVGRSREPAEFPTAEFVTWSDSAAFPLLPSDGAVEVFKKLRRHPRLDSPGRSWRALPHREFDATNDKHHLIVNKERAPRNAWPCYKGASFNLWEPDTGTYYAWADPGHVTEVLQDKRMRSARRTNSPFAEFDARWITDPRTLPCRHPRIAFRDVTNWTNTRTVIVALIPGRVVVTNQAPYLLWPRGDERDQAFLLGVLSSMILDWYARRVVETHVNFHLLNSFPIPDPGRDDPRRRRVEQIAGRLAAVDRRYKRWAEAVGVPVGSVSDAEKPALLAELDALVAHLYGLERGDVEVIYETFDEDDAAAYSARCDAVIEHLGTL